MIPFTSSPTTTNDPWGSWGHSWSPTWTTSFRVNVPVWNGVHIAAPTKREIEATAARLRRFCYGEMLELRGTPRRAPVAYMAPEQRPTWCRPRLGARRIRRRWRSTKSMKRRIAAKARVW